jgi:type III secretion system chaperone SycN
MSWVQQAISDFGESIGIPNLELGPEKSLSFALKSGKEIHIAYLDDASREEVLVGISAPLPQDYLSRIVYALRLCDFRLNDGWTLHTGISEGMLILAMRIPQRQFSILELERALAQLNQFHDEAAGVR